LSNYQILHKKNVNSINFLIKFLYSSFTARSEIKECRERDIDMNIISK